MKWLEALNKTSIRTRLTLSYAVVIFTLLSIITAFLYWQTVNNLYKADYQFLSDEVDTIQFILDRNKPDLAALKEVVIDIPQDTNSSIYRYFVRVIDADKHLMIETPGIASILQDANKGSTHVKMLGRKRYWYYTDDATDNDYLLITAPAKLGANKTGLIQIVLDVSHQHATMHDNSRNLLILIAIIACSLISGIFITQRGMKSLYVLTETTKKITASSLNQRIDPKSWPKELRELGFAFNQMLDRLQSSYLRLKQFSSDLAHELRTPVGNLIGGTEIALAYPDNNQDHLRNVLESNLEELNRISQLIENILFLAKTEQPENNIPKQLLNVKQEIIIVCEFYQALAEEKHINLSVSGEGSLLANSVMFRRMLSNLLSNAIKYTQENGHVHFDITATATALKITITDNGLGIAPEHLPKIFDRFYRTDAARTHTSGGVGLGLAIVKSIVELHKGKIAITSDLAKGTKVTILFPQGADEEILSK